MLLEECQLEAVISMPSGVFQPYSGVGTAVLVFVKGGRTENVWFYEMLKDGYSLDQKRDFIDGRGDIPDIIEKFKKREESDQSIVVPFERIKQYNYSLSVSRYKKVTHEEIAHEDPVKLIKKIIVGEEDILQSLRELERQLNG